jgi:hypothetical protein
LWSGWWFGIIAFGFGWFEDLFTDEVATRLFLTCGTYAKREKRKWLNEGSLEKSRNVYY